MLTRAKFVFSFAVSATVAVWLAGCSILDPKPKPTVSFTYSKLPYGRIAFRVTASNAKSYFWDFGDGSTSSVMEPAHDFLSDNSFTVTIKATGDGGSRSSSQVIVITDAAGEVMFWTTEDTGHGTVNIAVDNIFQGTVSKYYTGGTPTCYSDGCLTIHLSPGVHQFVAYTDDYYFTRQAPVTVIGGSCFSITLE